MFHRLSLLEAQLSAFETRPMEKFHLGLGEVMGYQQRWIDKLGLAAQASNWDAAKFYIEELEETAADIIGSHETHDGADVSQLATVMLKPAVAAVAEAVGKKDAALFNTHYPALVGTCNACHIAAKVPFIQVTTAASAATRWNQNFAPAAAGK